MKEESKEERKDNYKPFPVESLPNPLRDYVREISKGIGCPPEYIFLPLLGVTGGAIGSSTIISPAKGWEAPSSFYIAIVGESGAGKSPAYDEVMKLIQPIESDLHSLNQDNFEEYENAMSTWSKKDGPKPQEPSESHLIVSDTTMEALIQALSNNKNGIIVAVEELASWFGDLDRYVNKPGGDNPKWIALWKSKEITTIRKGARTIRAEYPVVSLIGTVQPEILKTFFSKKNVESGLISRFLLCNPPVEPQGWNDAGVPVEQRKHMQDVVGELYRLSRCAGKARVLELDDEAKALWIQYYEELSRERIPHAEKPLKYAMQKWFQYLLRIALVIHCVKCVESGDKKNLTVNAETFQEALAVMKWLEHETERVYEHLGADDAESRRKNLCYWIAKNCDEEGKVSVRAVQRGMSRIKTAEQARSELSDLQKDGVGSLLGDHFYLDRNKEGTYVELDASKNRYDREQLF